jgi:uncharacterized protein YecE (DUF72 family)
MARFWIGTSGWHYSHWRGSFYPERLPPREWLSHYCERFPTVELNASFYRQPKTSTWGLWRERAPQGFRFAVKASRFLTHIRRLDDPQEPLERVVAGARLLDDRLGPLLYQLPPGFHRKPENVARLEAFLPLLPGDLLHAIEFRHKSWFVDETASLLRRHGVAFCSFDMVGLECPLMATAPFAYVRFHGSEALYASNYTDEMLEGWAARLRALARETDEVYVYFNNDAGGYAVANALSLSRLLDAVPPPASGA